MKPLKLILSLCIPGVLYLFRGRLYLAMLVPAISILTLALMTATRAITTATGIIVCLSAMALAHIISWIHGANLSKHKDLSLPAWLLGWAALGILNALAPLAFHPYRAQALGMELYYIPSNSMAPTMLPGDVVIADKWQEPARLKKGDIVIFDHPEMHGINVIKRIAEITPDNVYVLGDNKENSLDSRTLGSIPLSAIQAKATTVISGTDYMPRSLTH
ncbi:S26 family signal peptidase [Pseudomonas solani]|uniref:S26 family signal peptidase n=1 Tax=Pseudomonas solani TaxID=2731552 RepID=UPI003D6BD096